MRLPRQIDSIFVILALLATSLHGLWLLSQPNDLTGLFGYSRSRIALIALSVILAGLFWLLSRHAHILRKARLALSLYPALGLLLGLLAAIGLTGLLVPFAFPLKVWPQQTQALIEYLRPTLALLAFLNLQVLVLGISWLDAPRKQKLFWGLTLVVGVAYTLIRIFNCLQLEAPYATLDSRQYIGESSWRAMLSPEVFWQGPRPFVLPLLGTLLKQDATLFAWVQTAVSIAAWLFLAIVFSRKLGSLAAQAIALLGLTAFSMGRNIVVWDWTILAESLSLSLMAILVGLWLLVVERLTWPRAIGLLLVSFIWAFTRDINAWLLCLLGLLLLAITILWRPSWKWGVLGVLMLGVFLLNWSSVNSTAWGRWLLPYMHALTFDVLTNEQATQFYIDNGMPASPRILAWPETFPDYGEYLTAEEFEPFRQWLLSGSRTTQIRYLLFNIPESLIQPFDASGAGFPVRLGLAFSRPFVYEPILPGPVETFFYFNLWNASGILWLFLALAVVAWLYYRQLHGANLVILVATALSYPYAFLSWHGDGLDKPRHLLPADVLLRLGMLLALLLVLDWLITRSAMAWRSRGGINDRI
ncbi:MAG: hypothetical protein KIS85_03400 [Anaerolineales bacterium]|nr:hypothetical protein [Anaerolineales bacterium]